MYPHTVMDTFNVTLASTLLDIHLEKAQDDETHKQRQPGKGKTGIKSLDRDLPESLWSRGKVIGMAHLNGTQANEVVGPTQNLAIDLITTRLWETSRDAQAIPSVYILAPPSSTTISSIYDALRARFGGTAEQKTSRRSVSAFVHAPLTTDPKTHGSSTNLVDVESSALALLEGISVLQYLDLVGLSEGVSEIASRGAQSLSAQDVLIYIEGLPGALATIVSRLEGGGRGESARISQYAALLGGVMRSVRLLCRDARVIMEIGVCMVPRSVRKDGGLDVVRTGFADDKGRDLCVCVSPVGKEKGMGNAERVLVKILEAHLDTLVLVHGLGLGVGNDSRGKDQQQTRVVEVVRDVTDSEFGGAMGSWATWT